MEIHEAILEGAATTEVERREHEEQEKSLKRKHNLENDVVHEGKWQIKVLQLQCRRQKLHLPHWFLPQPLQRPSLHPSNNQRESFLLLSFSLFSLVCVSHRNRSSWFYWGWKKSEWRISIFLPMHFILGQFSICIQWTVCKRCLANKTPKIAFKFRDLHFKNN